ncbi:putative metallophosphoesterase domain-containing protein [Aspergillus steynii IBT 23096]|uniref:Putative metallophosphoesterase domain-containing protein n=1 Tax=Aspergillus steynii IBT 23096 TaxID=1392250 RepID=A0A2I2G776_9EURO|nr:putative metallophosphoesterase domain-containing protein [Aspergillus steynii IBT 23096]PLB48730.1 putative metallophosphoesterase domain-containing protein [Aspergillus steynii IBT 23096]
MSTLSEPTIKTRFLVVSDTHGRENLPHEPADVAIHCGDLTNGSKLDEFKAAITLLKQLQAPLKLVIAGNHDFTLDIPIFQDKINEAWRLQSVDPLEIQQEYGYHGQVEDLFTEAQKFGIHFLREGIHRFTLENGASLTVYASPYTPSLEDSFWGFQYSPRQGHDFAIEQGVDIAITHGPPRGIFDYTHTGQRAGSTELFEAVARARPRMHCFGHIHGGWGAKLVGWRSKLSEKPSHLTDIDNGKSVVIQKLSNVKQAGKFQSCHQTSHCTGDATPLQPGAHTLFVNAAIEGSEDFPMQPAWIVDLDLLQSDRR